jgi:multisubunit Na+/H+ antiporter MnhB subunit
MTDLAQLAAAPWTQASSTTAAAQDKCAKHPVTINLLDGTNAPGLDALQHLTNIAGVVVLALCAFGALGGLAWIPAGRVIGVHHAGQQGRIMVVGSILVAFAVGLLAVLINLAYTWGSGATC